MKTPTGRARCSHRRWHAVFIHLIFAILILPVALLQAQHAESGKAPRVDPAGIPGSLVLCGNGEIPDAALQQFVEWAGGKDAHVVVVPASKNGLTEPARSANEYFMKQWLAGKIQGLIYLHIDKRASGVGKTVLKNLDAATGVWVSGDDRTKLGSLAKSALGDALRTVAQRGHVIGSSGAATAFLGDSLEIPDLSASVSFDGLDLLPGSRLSVADFGKKMPPGLFAFEIGSKVALLVRGRRMVAVGDGEVMIQLASCDFRPAKKIILEGKRRIADLTALRHAALARTQPQFPPHEPDLPVVEKGALVIVGGGGIPKGLTERFVELAGGPKSSIVVLPTAMPDPLPKKDYMAAALREAGAGKVTVLKGRKLSEVESPEFLRTLKEATGIWFGGGRQWRFADAYLDTKAHQLMHEVLQRGGVIGGSSAGASIQAEYLARGNPLGNLDIMAEGYERGLGFLKGVAIDQHFSQRKRFKDMSLLIETYPQLLGIGIDEATAIIVQGHIAEVVGRGKVHFYDANREIANGQPDYESVADGSRYDLKARKTLRNKQCHNKKVDLRNRLTRAKDSLRLNSFGQVAQLVERRTENP